MQRRSLRLLLAGATAILASACGDAFSPTRASTEIVPEIAKPQLTGFTITLGHGCDPNVAVACTPLVSSDTLALPDTTELSTLPDPTELSQP